MNKNNAANNKQQRIREVPAVRKAVAILNALSKESEPIGVNAISKKLNLVPSTCLHILRVLVSEGLVAFDPQTKYYALDVGILSLARSLMTGNELVKRIQPELNRLSRSFNATLVTEKVIDIEHSVVIAVSHAKGAMRLNVEVGSRFPTLVSATGRCYAAFGGESEIEIMKYFKRIRWSIAPNINEWNRQVGETREKGYAIDMGNYISGHMVIAVPLIERGIMTYGVAAVGDKSTLLPAEQELSQEIHYLINEVAK